MLEADIPAATGDIVVTMVGDVAVIQLAAYTISNVVQQATESTAIGTASGNVTTTITNTTPGAFIIDIMEHAENAESDTARKMVISGTTRMIGRVFSETRL